MTIKYNMLNLPELIQFKNGNQIKNSYAADGRKLKTEYYTLSMPLTVPIVSGQVFDIETYGGTVNYSNYSGLSHIDT